MWNKWELLVQTFFRQLAPLTVLKYICAQQSNHAEQCKSAKLKFHSKFEFPNCNKVTCLHAA